MVTKKIKSKLYLLILFGISCNLQKDHVVKFDYYPNGDLKTKIEIISESLDSLSYEEYYSNGKLKSKGYIKQNGLKIGYWEYYSQLNSLIANGNYDDGNKSGIWAYEGYEIDWSIYEENEEGFKINFPSSWKILKIETITSFFEEEVIENSVRNFNISTIATTDSLLSISNDVLNEISTQFDDVEKVDSFETKINSIKTLSSTYEIVNNGQNLYSMQVLYKVSNEKVLVLNLFSRDLATNDRDYRLFLEISNSLFWMTK